MKYANGQGIQIGDIVCWAGKPDDRGQVYCLIQDGVALDGSGSGWTYLQAEGGGVMVEFTSCGLVLFPKDEDDDHPDMTTEIELIARHPD